MITPPGSGARERALLALAEQALADASADVLLSMAVDELAALVPSDLVWIAEPLGSGLSRILAVSGDRGVGMQVPFPVPAEQQWTWPTAQDPADPDHPLLRHPTMGVHTKITFETDGWVLSIFRDPSQPFDDGEIALVSAVSRLLSASLGRQAIPVEEASRRRNQALSINDGIVQGLASIVYALQSGDIGVALDAAGSTLDLTRVMIEELLGADPAAGPGDLVRAQPAAQLLPGDLQVPAHERPSGPAVRILVADDSPDIRFLLRSRLDRDPALDVVGEAADGMEALELAEREQPDVVVLDLAMPRMDGFQVLSQLKERQPDTRVVVLSGLDAGRMGARALRAGADTYLEKGSATQSLRDVLAELFPERLGEEATDEASPTTAGSPEHLAHELRTPLTVIQGFADTLLGGLDRMPSSMVTEMLTAISRNARQMNGLIDAFAGARSVGTDALALTRQRLDLVALVRETVSDLSSVTERHRVRVHLPDAPVTVDADPLRLREIVNNLVSNAAKFSPPGSTIDVVVRTAGERTVDVLVADRGPGVPAQRRDELFRRYSRLGAASPGMGLGLYISRSLAAAHGGTLTFEPRDEGGSVFRLRLPRTQ